MYPICMYDILRFVRLKKRSKSQEPTHHVEMMSHLAIEHLELHHHQNFLRYPNVGSAHQLINDTMAMIHWETTGMTLRPANMFHIYIYIYPNRMETLRSITTALKHVKGQELEEKVMDIWINGQNLGSLLQMVDVYPMFTEHLTDLTHDPHESLDKSVDVNG